MKKALPLILLTALLLTGCGGKAQEPAQAPAPKLILETTAPETTVPVTLPDPTEETVELAYSAYQVTYTYLEDNGQEFYTFQGLDPHGTILWTRETAHLDLSQLQRTGPIGTWEDRFFYYEDGSVVCLDLVTGEELFRNPDFGGAGVTSLLDPAGFVYLCGYHGPDLFVMDVEGNTVKKIASLDPNYYWAFQIQQVGNELIISLEGDGQDSPEVHTCSVPMDWLPQPQG